MMLRCGYQQTGEVDLMENTLRSCSHTDRQILGFRSTCVSFTSKPPMDWDFDEEICEELDRFLSPPLTTPEVID